MPTEQKPEVIPLHKGEGANQIASKNSHDSLSNEAARALYDAMVYLIEAIERSTTIMSQSSQISSDVAKASSDVTKNAQQNMNDRLAEIDDILTTHTDPIMKAAYDALVAKKNAAQAVLDAIYNDPSNWTTSGEFYIMTPEGQAKYDAQQAIVNKLQDQLNGMQNGTVSDQDMGSVVGVQNSIYNQLNQGYQSSTQSTNTLQSTLQNGMSGQTDLQRAVQSILDTITSVYGPQYTTLGR